MPLLLYNGGEMMDQPSRKRNRLQNYDYSDPGAYFITLCTKDRRNLFWEDAGESVARPQDVALTAYGRITEKAIHSIAGCYPMIVVDHYVIMPNHVHLLLRSTSEVDGRAMLAPTISRVVQQMKGHITKQIGLSIWQKLFHDHVIRNEKDYQRIWNYIEGNPMRWREDCFYIE